MKLNKIYLFASVANQYGVIDNFIRELDYALNRQGVISRVIEAKRDDPHSFINELLSDPPDCTLSFNGLLPDAEGRFLCDLIKIPHVACLTDAPNHFFPLVKSPLTVITCVDRNFCQVFRDFNFSNVIFLPHATSKALNPHLDSQPQYDVLMLNSFIDYQDIQQRWADQHSPAMRSVLEEAAELTLNDYQIPYMQAFIQVLDEHLRAGKPIDPRLIDYEAILDDLEAYVGGKSRVELLQSIQEVTVHVFGSQPQVGGWKKYVGNKPNIKIHPPVSFSEALELMKRSKILLNCTPEIKQGAHERIFSGLACGAAVLTLDTPYMREQFKDGEDILLYGLRDAEAVNHKIRSYLNDEDKRNHLVGRGRERVMRHHTWDQRAQTLMHELPPILEKIQSHLQSI